MVRLHIPRLLPGILLALGLPWGVASAIGVIRRVDALLSSSTAAPAGRRVRADPLLSLAGMVPTALGLLLAAALVVVAIRWIVLRIDLSAEQVVVRRVTGRRAMPLGSVRGVVLVQGGGVPQLRIVGRDGDVLVVPGWSLQARHDDGEVEAAGPALQRFGAAHGIGVKLRSLTGPVPPAAGPRDRR